MRWELQGSSVWLIHDTFCFVNNATLIKSQGRLKEGTRVLIQKKGLQRILSCLLDSSITSTDGCLGYREYEGHSQLTRNSHS